MHPPPEFEEEFLAMRNRMEAGFAEVETEEDQIREAKATLRLCGDFFRRWHALIESSPEIQNAVSSIREHLAVMGESLETLYLTELQAVVSARRTFAAADDLFRALVPMYQVMTKVPAFRDDVIAQLEAETGRKTDPTEMFRQSEAAVAAEEDQYQAALGELQAGWPERCDAALRERLATLTVAQANAWEEEIKAQRAKLAPELD